MKRYINPATEVARRLIQRWFGVKETGDLNDPATVEMILTDKHGLFGMRDYFKKNDIIIGVKPEDPPVVVGDLPDPVDPSFSDVKSYPEVKHYTPNKGGQISSIGLVFHASYGSFAGTLSWIKKSASQVSYHVLINKDGTRHHVVPLYLRAWHAGKSKFKGRIGCNNFMVGIAFSENTYDRELTQDEEDSAVDFVRKYHKKYGWTLENITDHRTVSPGRKVDINPDILDKLVKRIALEVYGVTL